MSMKHYDFSSLKVLVVEDCKFMRQVLGRLLGVFEITDIIFASDGDDAFKKLRSHAVDLVFCDWEMAPVDGPTFVRSLRLDPESPAPYLPVIMLTGYTEESKVLAARDFGITEFLAKPVAARTLHQRLVSIVERPRQFVRTAEFFGPCRRRLQLPHFGTEKRKHETALRKTG